MQVTINGQTENIEPESISVTELLELKEVESPEMVSVQLNGTILDRSRFAVERIRAGDDVEFLYFMGGGAGR